MNRKIESSKVADFVHAIPDQESWEGPKADMEIGLLGLPYLVSAYDCLGHLIESINEGRPVRLSVRCLGQVQDVVVCRENGQLVMVPLCGTLHGAIPLDGSSAIYQELHEKNVLGA